MNSLSLFFSNILILSIKVLSNFRNIKKHKKIFFPTYWNFFDFFYVNEIYKISSNNFEKNTFFILLLDQGLDGRTSKRYVFLKLPDTIKKPRSAVY